MKLNKAEIDKKQYNTYKAGYNAFAAECAKLSARTLPPARIGAMELHCKKVLKKARVLLRRLPGDDIKRGDALIAFSKKMVLAISGVLAEGNIKSSVIYGNLPPETRRNQMKAFQEGKTMDVPFDSHAVIRRKYETADRIQDLLKERMGSMGRKCRRCGADLPWNHRYGICDRCYSRMRYRFSF